MINCEEERHESIIKRCEVRCACVQVRWFWSPPLTPIRRCCTMMVNIEESLLCRLDHLISFIITLMTNGTKCGILIGPRADSINFATLQAFPLVVLLLSGTWTSCSGLCSCHTELLLLLIFVVNFLRIGQFSISLVAILARFIWSIGVIKIAVDALPLFIC